MNEQPANQTVNSTQTPPQKNRIYPELIIPYNEHPKRWLAIPIIGYIIRVILLIPIVIVFLFLEIWYWILMIITPFVILFTGQYWDFAYKWTLIYMRFYTKMMIYAFGLSDKYPGFSFDENGMYILKYDKPVKPSRFHAFPLIGYLGRAIILIPYSIYSQILEFGSFFAVIFSWFAILFTGRYPESLYEFIKDYLRVSNASTIYMSYLSDEYPNFQISFNHKTIKIILIILGLIFALLDLFNSINKDIKSMQGFQNSSANINSAPNSGGSDE